MIRRAQVRCNGCVGCRGLPIAIGLVAGAESRLPKAGMYSSVAVDVYWVDYDGVQEFYFSLASGESNNEATFYTLEMSG